MQPDLVTFDCYGTLIDWRSGIRDAFREHVPDSLAVDDGALFSTFAEIENAIEASAYRPYRQVLGETALAMAARFGWELAFSDAAFLANSLPSWKAFPDVNPSLERLRALGCRIGILSNIDDDLLTSTLQHIRVPFDVLVTAEQVRSYKPSSPHFRRALEIVDGKPDRLLHIAQSHYHDVRAAVPLGIPVVWVNRHRDPLPEGGPRPTADVRSLADAVEWLELQGARLPARRCCR